MFRFFVAFITTVVFAASAWAGVPSRLAVQGALSNAGGPVNGSYDMWLTIYDDKGVAQYTEFHNEVPVTSGAFRVVVGDNKPIPLDLFMTGTQTSLAITVDKEPELPAVPFAAVPYAMVAMHAETAAHATTADSAKDAEHAKTADSAKEAETAKDAEHAKTADSAKEAETAKDAEHAKTADSAKEADTAKSAATAQLAEHAKTADSAKEAETAKSAATAQLAEQAKNATMATGAKVAETAQLAEHAKTADSAKEAETAKSAATAQLAEQAKNATMATGAKVAEMAKEADHAKTADSAIEADTAKSAATAQLAEQAKTATMATGAKVAETAQALDCNGCVTQAHLAFDPSTLFTMPNIMDVQNENGASVLSVTSNKTYVIVGSGFGKAPKLRHGLTTSTPTGAVSDTKIVTQLTGMGVVSQRYMLSVINTELSRRSNSVPVDWTPLLSVFGTGNDGDLTVSGPNTVVNKYIKVTSAASKGGKSLSVSSTTGFPKGTDVLIIQMQSSGVGAYELNRVSAVASNTLSLVTSLTANYGSGGPAQVVSVPQYRNLTVTAAGNIVASPWNGTTGGIVAFRASDTATVSGSIHTDAMGYRGGKRVQDGAGHRGNLGESTVPSKYVTGSNGNNAGGGGVGYCSCGEASGAAGYGTKGGTPSGAACSGNGHGDPGLAYGQADLGLIYLGSGGGGGCRDDTSCEYTDGSNGGGIVMAFANTLNVTGSMRANGGKATGGDASQCDDSLGGAGSGGSVFVTMNKGTLGNNTIQAKGGGSTYISQSNINSGVGGVGRIRVDFITLNDNSYGTLGAANAVNAVTIPEAGHTAKAK